MSLARWSLCGLSNCGRSMDRVALFAGNESGAGYGLLLASLRLQGEEVCCLDRFLLGQNHGRYGRARRRLRPVVDGELSAAVEHGQGRYWFYPRMRRGMGCFDTGPVYVGQNGTRSGESQQERYNQCRLHRASGVR